MRSVLLAGVDEEQLYNKLDDFRREISITPIDYGQEQISYSVSLGVTFNSTESFAQQMRDADTALFVAKENGRNQISIFGRDD